MRPSDMRHAIAIVCVAALLMTGCDTAPTAATGPSEDEIIIDSGGPCAEGPDSIIGETGVTVTYAGQSVNASFNYSSIGACPGHDMAGSIHGDGFLLDLSEKAVSVSPGDVIEVKGPGYPGAVLTSNLDFVEPPVIGEPGGLWLLRSPVGAGEHEVRLALEWSAGRAEYGFVAVVEPRLFGPARLETGSNGLLALDDDGAQVYFHLGGLAQGYGDGAGGLIYQSLHEWRWVNHLDVMWVPLGAREPQVLVAAGDDSQQLQGIDDEEVLTVAVSQDDSNGIIPDERRLVLTDLRSGDSNILLSMSSEEDTGMGRASILDGKIVVSLRSKECTWFEFIDTTGAPIHEPHNPRPEAEACSQPLVTGAVLLDNNLVAYVETEPHLEYEFAQDGPVVHWVSFTRAPVQTVVIESLDSGHTVDQIPIEPAGTTVDWLERVRGGVSVSLGTLGFGDEEPDSSQLPALPRAPLLGDLGSDFGGFIGWSRPSGSLLITVADGDVSPRDWWLSTDVQSISETGICSAALTELDIGPPTGVTGLGVDVPITLYELTPEADETRMAVRDTALACDYDRLAALVTVDRPSPAFFSGPDAAELADYWRELENSGEYVLATLAELLRYAPTGQNPFRWDTDRGDVSFSNANVSINADGEWVGFQVP